MGQLLPTSSSALSCSALCLLPQTGRDKEGVDLWGEGHPPVQLAAPQVGQGMGMSSLWQGSAAPAAVGEAAVARGSAGLVCLESLTP